MSDVAPSSIQYEAIDSSALEAIHAAKPLWCRIRLSFQWTTSRLLMLCASKTNIMFMNYVCNFTALKSFFPLKGISVRTFISGKKINCSLNKKPSFILNCYLN